MRSVAPCAETGASSHRSSASPSPSPRTSCPTGQFCVPPASPGQCTCRAPVCGNDIREGEEQCDGRAICSPPDAFTCVDCRCVLTTCGNGVRDPFRRAIRRRIRPAVPFPDVFPTCTACSPGLRLGCLPLRSTRPRTRPSGRRATPNAPPAALERGALLGRSTSARGARRTISAPRTKPTATTGPSTHRLRHSSASQTRPSPAQSRSGGASGKR